jgi:hypothetical protein
MTLDSRILPTTRHDWVGSETPLKIMIGRAHNTWDFVVAQRGKQGPEPA